MSLAAALVLYAVESAFPSPLPFLRVGLANIVTLLLILTMGVREAVLVTGLRVVVASLILGTFLGPGFLVAIVGGLSSAVAMGAAARMALPPLGVVGVSLIGAAAHNLAQVSAVGWLYVGVGPALRLIPAALFLAAAAGLATGLVARFVLEKLPPRAA